MKNRFSTREKVVRSLMMTVLIAFLVIVGIKISKDYSVGVVYSQEEHRLSPESVAGETISISKTVSPTVSPTVTATPTPTVDPGTQVVVLCDYLNETITVSKGPRESTKFYFSQDKKKTWQLIDHPNGKMDLAIFMKTSDNIIYFKGNKDESPVEVKIPKEEKNLKVTYYVENNQGKLKLENTSSNQSVQYRKGKDGQWIDYTGLDLRDYEITGFTLQFRTRASVTQRAGKIVSVKIPKRPNPPSIKVDYSKFCISGLKPGVTQYRLAGSGQWLEFNPTDKKVKTLSLSELLLPKDTPQNFKPIPAGKIEFITKATDKKVASGVLTVDTVLQPSEPDGSKVTLVGTSLTFTDASKDKVYEYILAHEGDKIDLATAKWKKVSNSKTIIIKKVGTADPIPKDVVYYRLAPVKDKVTKQETPASMYGKKVITAVSN